MCSGHGEDKGSKNPLDKKLRKLDLESEDVHRNMSSTFWDLTLVGEGGWILYNFCAQLSNCNLSHCIYSCHVLMVSGVYASEYSLWPWAWTCDLIWPMKWRQKLPSVYGRLTLLYFCHHHNNRVSRLAHWSQSRRRNLWSRTPDPHPAASNRAFPASPYIHEWEINGYGYGYGVLILLWLWGFNIDSYPVIIDQNISEIKVKEELRQGSRGISWARKRTVLK